MQPPPEISLQHSSSLTWDGRQAHPSRCGRYAFALLMALGSAVFAAVCIWHFGDDADNPAGSIGGSFKCRTDLLLSSVVAEPSKKGLTIDDATLQKCASEIPRVWPNTEQPLKSLRLFKAWGADWSDVNRKIAWTKLKTIVQANDLQVLVGTQVTCNEEEDDRDWRMVLQLMKMLGRQHVMGVAVGNELDLLWQKPSTPKGCVTRIWEEGYPFTKLQQRAADIDQLEGFQDVPLTSVYSGYILAEQPFLENPEKAMVKSFLKEAVNKFGSRWVFSLNVYPYFDLRNQLDPGSSSKCSMALAHDLCFRPDCSAPSMASVMRQRMKDLTGSDKGVLWLTETGWSSPKATTLQPPMTACSEFSSQESLQKYYFNFLKWDLSLDPGVRGPDHVFYFTARDSYNFGDAESFGILEGCGSTDCKLQQPAKRMTRLHHKGN